MNNLLDICDCNNHKGKKGTSQLLSHSVIQLLRVEGSSVINLRAEPL